MNLSIFRFLRGLNLYTMCSELSIMFRIRDLMEEEMWVWKEEQKQKKSAKNKEKRSKTCAKREKARKAKQNAPQGYANQNQNPMQKTQSQETVEIVASSRKVEEFVKDGAKTNRRIMSKKEKTEYLAKLKTRQMFIKAEQDFELYAESFDKRDIYGVSAFTWLLANKD